MGGSTLISPTFHAFNFYCMRAEYTFGGDPGQLGAEALTMQTSPSAHSPRVQALPFPSALLILIPCREAGQRGVPVHRSPVIPSFLSRRLRVRREPLDGMALSLGLCPGDPENRQSGHGGSWNTGWRDHLTVEIFNFPASSLHPLLCGCPCWECPSLLPTCQNLHSSRRTQHKALLVPETLTMAPPPSPGAHPPLYLHHSDCESSSRPPSTPVSWPVHAVGL